MTKKLLALVMALCLVLGASSALAEKLTVTAWDANFNGNALKAAYEDYKANVDPDFELEINIVSGSSDVEQAITTAGASYDYSNLSDIVLFQDHYIQSFVLDYPDAWMDLEDAGINWDDFGAEKLSYSTVDGVHYGVPVDNGTAIMAYRVNLLEQCGYTIADMTGITWDKFLEVGKEVYAKTGKALLSMDGGGNDLPYMLLQAEGKSQFKDGKPYITENEDLVKIVKLICDMINEHVLILANDWTGYTNETIMQDQVAGVLNGNWIIPTMSQVTDNTGKWEITTLPTLNGGEGYAANGGSSLYITANCKNPELAKKFLAYTFGGSTQTYDNALRTGGVIGCCISAAKSNVYQEGVPFFNGQAVYSKIVEMGASVPIVEQNDYHYTCRTAIGNAIQNILTGMDVMEALTKAENELKFAMGM
ncbi:MAG: carbohydrate ABC transporter substrate-binding protein [Clostridia bacterium]|nr:carbohydrate ABC transporter substrate-binding protein [Clostridia bacterium]